MSRASPTLAVDIRQDGSLLRWRVANVSATPVWAFLLVPSTDAGLASFAADVAWLEPDGELLVVRKVDTPAPEERKVERVSSGAVALGPGEVRHGAIVVGDEVTVGGAYSRERRRARPSALIMEVGWVPVRAGQAARRLSFAGEPFVYLRSELEPGGQRFARSSPLRWSR